MQSQNFVFRATLVSKIEMTIPARDEEEAFNILMKMNHKDWTEVGVPSIEDIEIFETYAEGM